MSKGYIWISMEVLGELLRLPEGMRVEGIITTDFGQGRIGLVVSGEDLPTDGETMSELTAIFQSTRDGDFRFSRWKGTPE